MALQKEVYKLLWVQQKSGLEVGMMYDFWFAQIGLKDVKFACNYVFLL
jgi:hypothetical protein